MARSNLRYKKLAGKTVLFVYDSPHKREAVESVFSEADMRCQRLYARDVPHAERLLKLSHDRGRPIDLVVCDYELTDDAEKKPAETGGDFYEKLRGGEYDHWLANAKTVPFIFDSGEDRPERYRGRENTFIRAMGGSLPLTCADAINHAEEKHKRDTISRPRSFYPSEAVMRDMYADQGGYIGNDNANVRHQQALLAKRENENKEREK